MGFDGRDTEGTQEKDRMVENFPGVWFVENGSVDGVAGDVTENLQSTEDAGGEPEQVKANAASILEELMQQVPQHIVDSIYRNIRLGSLTGPEFTIKGTNQVITVNPEKWLYAMQLPPKVGGSMIVYEVILTNNGPVPLGPMVNEVIGTHVPERKIITMQEWKDGKGLVPPDAG